MIFNRDIFSRCHKTLLSIGLLLSISGPSLIGCVNYAGIHSNKKIAHPKQFSTQLSIPEQQGAWPTLDWAKQYGDPQLLALIQEALACNPSLALARARLDQAVATTSSRAAALYPSVNAMGSSYRMRLSSKRLFPPPLRNSTFTLTSFLTGLNYTLDLWGKNRSHLKQAISETKAKSAEEQETRLSIATSIAATYNQLAYYYQLRDLLQHTVRQRQKLDAISQARLRTGLDTKVQVYQALNSTAAAKTKLREAEGQILLTKYQLGALLGAGPDRGLLIKRPKLRTVPTPPLPNNLPLNLLGRRPDIVKARWLVEAACQGINFVKAQFYPNINLKAGIAYFALALSQFTIKANAEYAGPAISLPLFDAGALRARLRGQYAFYEEAVAQYNATLNQALAEVAEQLASIESADNQLRSHYQAQEAARQAFELARYQYRVGLTSQLVVLEAESRFLDEQQIRLQLFANRRNLQIALIKALGGGFDACAVRKNCCCTPPLNSK